MLQCYVKCEMYWKTKDTSFSPTSARSKSSWLFLSSAFVKWFHLYERLVQHERGRNSTTYELASPYNIAAALAICFPSLHRLHLNVSWVSQRVPSLKMNNLRRASTEKCRSISSFSSTTADERACLFACRWKIFSSMVPVEMKR